MHVLSHPEAAAFEAGPPDIEQLQADLAELRARLLNQTNIVGAGAAVLDAIHRAGGYHVFDPQHHDRVERALDALGQAVTTALQR